MSDINCNEGIKPPQLLLNLSEVDYHADPCEKPSLSSSIAVDLITLTPKHVWHKHPRFGNNKEQSGEACSRGSMLHSLLFGGDNPYAPLPYSDFRTKEAREARDAVIASGKTPLTEEKYTSMMCDYEKMIGALHEQVSLMAENSNCLDGFHEASLIWQDNDGIHNRCRFDCVNFDNGFITDYKTTSVPIHQWIKAFYRQHKDIQAAHYENGFFKYCGKKPRFKLLVQETYAPYLAAVIEIDMFGMDFAQAKLAYARDIWKSCMETDVWPGYPSRSHHISPPAWCETEFEMLRMSREIDLEDKKTQKESIDPEVITV